MVFRKGLQVALVSPLLFLGACQTPVDSSLPRGPAAYAVIPPPSADQARLQYKIGPLDLLSVTVFQEPSLTFPQLPVDASGDITMPLIGAVHASGKTARELAHDLEAAFDAKYLRNAQISVVVVSSVSQHVTVEGSVNQPGLYEISGTSSLLQALALARSPTTVADLNQVVVFRQIDGKRAGAVFNVNDIRAGKVPDPAILGGDVVVVGFSSVKGAFRDLLKTAPFFNLFRYF